ncbi:hypothetical protein PoB_006024100 [Plakobranchus ocellatus]|uniref:Uncharacterized protein n=1 Tax=Plakobranchus ocellatus TaxID=259542 RepID=A0AAV4CPE1_9GAST|nr:hypothetical protein PoB_006024100 [Plakobranchus ocellatus]
MHKVATKVRQKRQGQTRSKMEGRRQRTTSCSGWTKRPRNQVSKMISGFQALRKSQGVGDGAPSPRQKLLADLGADSLPTVPPRSCQGAGGGARTRDRRVPADLRTDSLATVPPTPSSPQQKDLRLSGPLSGQAAGGGARARNRRVSTELRADSLATRSHELARTKEREERRRGEITACGEKGVGGEGRKGRAGRELSCSLVELLRQRFLGVNSASPMSICVA